MWCRGCESFQAQAVIKYNSRMRFLQVFVGALLTVALVVVVVVISIGFFLSPQSKLEQSDLIIAISGGETSQRTNEAIRLYRDGLAPKVLFSGAAADHSGPSNAAAMRIDAI